MMVGVGEGTLTAAPHQDGTGRDGSGVSPPRVVGDTAHVIDLRGDGTGGVWV